MEIGIAIGGGLAIILGILVLVMPKILRFAVGLWLIVWGILQFI